MSEMINNKRRCERVVLSQPLRNRLFWETGKSQSLQYVSLFDMIAKIFPLILKGGLK